MALSSELLPCAWARPYTVDGQLRLAGDPEMEYPGEEPGLGRGGVEVDLVLRTQLTHGKTLTLNVLER